MMARNLSNEEMLALEEFAQIHGRKWKQTLRDHWMNGKCSGTLQRIRNTHGPSVLAKVTIKG